MTFTDNNTGYSDLDSSIFDGSSFNDDFFPSDICPLEKLLEKMRELDKQARLKRRVEGNQTPSTQPSISDNEKLLGTSGVSEYIKEDLAGVVDPRIISSMQSYVVDFNLVDLIYLIKKRKEGIEFSLNWFYERAVSILVKK